MGRRYVSVIRCIDAVKSMNRLRFACNVSYFTCVKCGTLLMLTVYSCVSCVRFVVVHYFLSSCYVMLALLMWKLYHVRLYSLISMISGQGYDTFFAKCYCVSVRLTLIC